MPDNPEPSAPEDRPKQHELTPNAHTYPIAVPAALGAPVANTSAPRHSSEGFPEDVVVAPAGNEPTTMPQAVATRHHASLQAFSGMWNVTQRQWRGPADTSPRIHTGKAACTVLLNGLSVIVETSLSNGWQGVMLQTFNPLLGRFEMAFADTLGEQGIVFMTGRSTAEPSRPELQAQFGSLTRQVRSWTTSAKRHAICTDPDRPRTSTLLMTIVENQVSPDQWVVEFFLTQEDGCRFLTQQNVFTRV
jgi:hypothetical protein